MTDGMLEATKMSWAAEYAIHLPCETCPPEKSCRGCEVWTYRDKEEKEE